VPPDLQSLTSSIRHLCSIRRWTRPPATHSISLSLPHSSTCCLYYGPKCPSAPLLLGVSTRAPSTTTITHREPLDGRIQPVVIALLHWSWLLTKHLYRAAFSSPSPSTVTPRSQAPPATIYWRRTGCSSYFRRRRRLRRCNWPVHDTDDDVNNDGARTAVASDCRDSLMWRENTYYSNEISRVGDWPTGALSTHSGQPSRPFDHRLWQRIICLLASLLAPRRINQSACCWDCATNARAYNCTLAARRTARSTQRDTMRYVTDTVFSGIITFRWHVLAARSIGTQRYATRRI